MDTAIGIKGKDFVLFVADAQVARSIQCLKQTEDKIYTMDDDKMVALGGQVADRIDFADHIRKDVHLYKYRNGYKLTVKETANYCRSEIARNLRRRMW